MHLSQEEIEQLEKIGLIKPASEAFKDYPVEEEIHQGDINYFVAETIIRYGKYKVGDIVYVKEYQYEDGTIGNNHLFVIVDDQNKSVPLEYFGFILSSKILKSKYETNELIKKNSINNLNKDSIIKLDVLYLISSEDIIKVIGKVSENELLEYKEKYNYLINSYFDI